MQIQTCIVKWIKRVGSLWLNVEIGGTNWHPLAADEFRVPG
jgi:hypothetical protein